MQATRWTALLGYRKLILGLLFGVLLSLTACGGKSDGLDVVAASTTGGTTTTGDDPDFPFPSDPGTPDPGTTDPGTSTTTTTTGNPPPPAPPAPVISAVSAGSISTTGAIITWTTDIAATSQVFYGTSASYGSQSALSSTPLTAHSVALSNLSPGTTYHFKVSSQANARTTSSNDVTFSTAATPPNPPQTAPSAPTGLAATTVNQHRIDLHWNDTSSNETAFNVFVAIGSAGTFRAVATLGAGATSFAVTHLHPERPYRFRVDAVNAVGSTPSNIASAVTRPRTDANGDGRSDLNFTWMNGDYLFGYSQGRAADSNIFGFASTGVIAGWAGVFDTASTARFFQGDFDGDGRADLAFTWTYNGDIEVRLTSEGVWRGHLYTDLVGQIGSDSVNRFFIGDFNGDGADEIALAMPDGSIHVGHYNLSTHTFDWGSRIYGIDPNVGYSTWGKYIFPSNSQARFWVGDFNGDGLDDIAFTWVNGAIVVGFGDGNYGFNFVGDLYAYDQNTQTSYWGQYIFPPNSNTRMFVGDFNGDGKDDIMFLWGDGHIWTGNAVNYPNSPFTHFAFDFSAQDPNWGKYIFLANSNMRWFRGDFNGDGADDIAFAYNPDSSIWIGLSNRENVKTSFGWHAKIYGAGADGNSGWGAYIYPENSGWRWYSGDFDGDGKYDVGFAFGNGAVLTGYSNGDGTLDWRGRSYGDAPDGTHAWGQYIFPTTSHARFGNDLLMYGRTP